MCVVNWLRTRIVGLPTGTEFAHFSCNLEAARLSLEARVTLMDVALAN